MVNPYDGIDFSQCTKVMSFTHSHGPTQENLNRLFNYGYTFLPVSNYYPSAPLDVSQFEIPDNVIIAPNAEHHNFLIHDMKTVAVHLNSLGSTFSSGSAKNSGGVVGYGWGRWQTFMKDVFRNLKYSDAGGVTINHPTWTRGRYPDNEPLYLTDEIIIEMLDYDPRVLGVEMHNGRSGYETDTATWDNILMTGMKCWGFCTPDWDVVEHGANGKCMMILLVDDFTEHECLKAYREGRFYCKEYTTNLAFSQITVDDHTISVETENADYINVVVDGETTQYQTNEVEVEIPENATYARIEAKTDNDAVYSQPIIYKQFIPHYTSKKRNDDFVIFYE